MSAAGGREPRPRRRGRAGTAMNMDNDASNESHVDVREALFAGDEAGASVLAHLEVCADCARLVEEVDRVEDLTGSVVVPPPSAGLQEWALDTILGDYDD